MAAAVDNHEGTVAMALFSVFTTTNGRERFRDVTHARRNKGV